MGCMRRRDSHGAAGPGTRSGRVPLASSGWRARKPRRPVSTASPRMPILSDLCCTLSRGGDIAQVYENNWDLWQNWMNDVSKIIPYQ